MSYSVAYLSRPHWRKVYGVLRELATWCIWGQMLGDVNFGHGTPTILNLDNCIQSAQDMEMPALCRHVVPDGSAVRFRDYARVDTMGFRGSTGGQRWRCAWLPLHGRR